jgi:hypothetical protein
MAESPPEEVAQGAQEEVQAPHTGGNAATAAQVQQEGNRVPAALQQLNAVLNTCGLTNDQDGNHFTQDENLQLISYSCSA